MNQGKWYVGGGGGHLVIEPVDVTELVLIRDQAGFRSPLSKSHRANNAVIRWGSSWNAEANPDRTLLNTYASAVNQNQYSDQDLKRCTRTYFWVRFEGNPARVRHGGLSVSLDRGPIIRSDVGAKVALA